MPFRGRASRLARASPAFRALRSPFFGLMQTVAVAFKTDHLRAVDQVVDQRNDTRGIGKDVWPPPGLTIHHISGRKSQGPMIWWADETHRNSDAVI